MFACCLCLVWFVRVCCCCVCPFVCFVRCLNAVCFVRWFVVGVCCVVGSFVRVFDDCFVVCCFVLSSVCCFFIVCGFGVVCCFGLLIVLVCQCGVLFSLACSAFVMLLWLFVCVRYVCLMRDRSVCFVCVVFGVCVVVCLVYSAVSCLFDCLCVALCVVCVVCCFVLVYWRV